MKLNPFAKPAPPAGRRRPVSDLTPAPTPFAYSSQRAEAAATPPKRSARSWYQRLGLVVIYLAGSAILINILSLSPHAKILTLNTQNQALLRNANIYRTAADQQLNGSIWNRSKLTINTVKLRQQLQAQFPEIASVNVTLPLLSHTPVIYLTPAKPALILSRDNGALVIAADGKAILRSDAGSPVIKQLNLPQIEDQSGFAVQSNRQVLPASQVSFMQNIITQLQSKQYTVSGMTLPPASSELDVHLAGQPFFVKFNLNDNDPRGQAGTFLATIATLKRQNITPSKYVDVRIVGRAYYQ